MRVANYEIRLLWSTSRGAYEEYLKALMDEGLGGVMEKHIEKHLIDAHGSIALIHFDTFGIQVHRVEDDAQGLTPRFGEQGQETPSGLERFELTVNQDIISSESGPITIFAKSLEEAIKFGQENIYDIKIGGKEEVEEADIYFTSEELGVDTRDPDFGIYPKPYDGQLKVVIGTQKEAGFFRLGVRELPVFVIGSKVYAEIGKDEPETYQAIAMAQELP